MTPEESAREFIGADALAGIGYEKWLDVATRAIEHDRAHGIATPTIESAEGSILLSEHFGSATQGDLTIELYHTPYLLEAEVRRTFTDGRPSELVLKERLNIRPSLDSWLKTLLDRAQKGTS